MINTKTVFIGISLLSPAPIFTMVMLDHGMRLIANAEGKLDEAVAFCTEQAEAVVALDLPRRPNNGAAHLVEPEARASNRGRPQRRGLDMRQCEVLLRRQGVKIYATPAHLDECPQWMKTGFMLYDNLQSAGFVMDTAAAEPRQMVETHSESIFRSLLTKPLLATRSLEGRLQRHLLLYDHGLQLIDPMNYFEEITRSRVLQGNLPSQMLFTPAQLDALACAFLAWRLVNRPHLISRIGDMQEGWLVLPVWKELEASQPVNIRQMDLFGQG
ncbi:MAG: DUF429 domain-containing protein [Anaerolineae bacterium]|nr:DUF429 domain-containing protein [Anaerolineae bacterium]